MPKKISQTKIVKQVCGKPQSKKINPPHPATIIQYSIIVLLNVQLPRNPAKRNYLSGNFRTYTLATCLSLNSRIPAFFCHPDDNQDDEGANSQALNLKNSSTLTPL